MLVAGCAGTATPLPFAPGEGTHHSPIVKGFRGISSLRSGIPRSLDARLLALFSAGAERQWEM